MTAEKLLLRAPVVVFYSCVCFAGNKGITDKGAASLIQVLANNMSVTGFVFVFVKWRYSSSSSEQRCGDGGAV